MFPRIVKIFSIIFTLSLLLIGCDRGERYYTHYGFAQGGEYKVTYSLDRDDSEKISTEITKMLLDIDNSISGYNNNSIITQIANAQKGERIKVDSIFLDLWQKSEQIYNQSDALFDPSASPLFDLWGFGFKSGIDVTKEAVDSVMGFVGMDKFTLSEENGSYFISKSDSRSSLNFNAIAQGYSCDCIADILDKYGSQNYLVDIGEIVCKGLSSKGLPWKIGVDKPIDGNQNPGEQMQSIIDVTDCAVVTSGNYRKFYIKDGKKYSHTINPKIGYPVDHNLLSATVVAESGAIADAYATWFMVLGLEETKSVLDSLDGIQVLLIYGDNDDMKVYSTIK